VQLAQLVGGVGAVHLEGALGPCSYPGPDLETGVFGPDEEHKIALFVAWGDHRHRLRLGEPGELPEERVLTEGMDDVVIADDFVRCRDHGETLRTDDLGETTPCLCVAIGHGTEGTAAVSAGS